jgi:hypothetical protein
MIHHKDLDHQIKVFKVVVSNWCSNQTLQSIENLGSIDKV